jgi:hypothetical protein
VDLVSEKSVCSLTKPYSRASGLSKVRRFSNGLRELRAQTCLGDI